MVRLQGIMRVSLGYAGRTYWYTTYWITREGVVCLLYVGYIFYTYMCRYTFCTGSKLRTTYLVEKYTFPGGRSVIYWWCISTHNITVTVVCNIHSNHHSTVSCKFHVIPQHIICIMYTPVSCHDLVTIITLM